MKYYKIISNGNSPLLYACDSETNSFKLISTSEDLPLIDMSFVIIEDEIHRLYGEKESILGVYEKPVKDNFILKAIIDDYLNTELVLTGSEETLCISVYRKGKKQGTIKNLIVPFLYYEGTIRFKLDCNENPYNYVKPLSNAEVHIINMVMDAD